MHYVQRDGKKYAVDESRDSFIHTVQTVYDGDYYSFAEDYYTLVADVFLHTGCLIIGHFDLITKYNEDDALFDSSHPRYRRAAGDALDELAKYDTVLEINTGAIARGYRKKPYPELWLLNRWLEKGKPVVLSSDCHDKRCLLHGFEEAESFVSRPELLLFRLPNLK